MTFGPDLDGQVLLDLGHVGPVQPRIAMTNWRGGSVNFEQGGVEFPNFRYAVNVTGKFFHGAVGTPRCEVSLDQAPEDLTGRPKRPPRR